MVTGNQVSSQHAYKGFVASLRTPEGSFSMIGVMLASNGAEMYDFADLQTQEGLKHEV